jgi:hypothetical protein
MSHLDFNDPADKYRFYLCVEVHNFNRYECTLGDAKQAREFEIRAETCNMRSIIVPVDKRVPKMVDFMFINTALKPTFSIVR